MGLYFNCKIKLLADIKIIALTVNQSTLSINSLTLPAISTAPANILAHTCYRQVPEKEGMHHHSYKYGTPTAYFALDFLYPIIK
jgi:hypothetical protein